MTRIIDHLSEHPPNYGPEWGSGGIFGLKYHRGILYYMLAFEAQGYFIDHNGIKKIYEFEKLGSKPVSGGDTYNAVCTVDDTIFFGGWVHAPAVYRGRSDKGSTIDFRNKYSHVHMYDINNNDVVLIWKESIHDPEKWVGEVSEILYDPYDQKLLLARADGHINLGVYELDPVDGKARKLLDEPALKGTLHLDYACFSIHYFPEGFQGIECIDLIEKKTVIEKIDLNKYAIDNGEVLYPQVGPVSSLYGRVFAFVKGGVVIYDPVDREKYFIRLLDIPYSQLAPARTNTKIFGGGILVAYNMFVHSVVNPTSEFEIVAKRITNTIVSPTLLLYVAPPLVKIVGAFGARITSIEVIGEYILLAHNTMANTARYDASPHDQGVRGFTILNTNIINNPPPSVTIAIPGWMIKEKVFGGIPLTGYKDPKLIIKTKKENKLTINEYVFTIPPMMTYSETISINSGRTTVSLNNYSGIVSFKFEKSIDADDIIIIDLI